MSPNPRTNATTRFGTFTASSAVALALAIAALAAGFYVLAAGTASNLIPFSAAVARADVIDEYEEPPPPTPQPEPQPSPGGGGGSKPTSGGSGSGSSSGSSYSYSADTPSSSTNASADKKKAKSEKPKRVTPEADRPATVALHEPSSDSFFAAAFGGAGWLLPVLMIVFAIGAAVYMRFGNSGQSRIESPNPRTSRSRPRS